jgi:carboxymethylenebutenolidase
MFQLMASINIPLVMEDTRALLAFADGQPAARKEIVGSVGYCMSGQYAINAATHFPERVKAAASIYGVQLATDRSDSPHLAGQKAKAELYFGCAETDVYAPMEIVEKVKQQMKDDGANAEVEIYPGTHHGFAFPKRPVTTRLLPSVTGNGCWRSIAATCRNKPGVCQTFRKPASGNFLPVSFE